jgi:HSP20 family molecular chaperone IbpA
MSSQKPKRGRGYQDTEGSHLHTTLVGNQFVVVRHSHAWRPPTDVYEDNDSLVILVEVAGMQKGEFNVVLDERHLMVSGTRPPRLNTKPAFHQLEVRYGEFRVDVELPWPVDENGVEATYDDGFLRVELPRARAHHIVDVEKAGSD